MNRVKAFFRSVGGFFARHALKLLSLAFVTVATAGVYLLTVVGEKRFERPGIWKTSWSPDPALDRYEIWAAVLFCIAAGLFLTICLVAGWKLWRLGGCELEKRRQPAAAAPAPQGAPGPAAQGGTP